MNCFRASDYIKNELQLPDFHINSCGYFTEIDCSTSSRRINGRPDFQLIGVINGKMNLQLSDGICCVYPGQAILFKPGEPQIYGMSDESNGAYYWIHFVGENAETVLQACGLYDGNIFDVGCSSSDIDIICEMISEITRKPKCYQYRNKSLFLQLITDYARRTPDTVELGKHMNKIRPALTAMENGDKNIDIKGYADMCFMSEFYFLHTFKETMGMTPIKYKNMIVMEKVKTLLRNTELTIKEIAQQCGFSDPLYLTKKFKSDFGYTPTEYRRQHR